MRSRDRLNALYRDDRPLVFAHRGAMAYAPMNTMASFQLAVDQNADGIELDVYLTQDDIPVVIHDFDVSHTTDGEGRVGSMTLEEIRELDAGSWFDSRFSGEQVPTLDDVFEAFGNKLYINVEIKALQLNTKHYAHQVAECIKRHGMQERVIVSSFNPLVLRNMRQAISDIPIGYLEAPEVKWYIKTMLIGFNFDAWHPENIQITKSNTARTHRRGRRLNTWTVNDPAEAKKLSDMGVDMLITDNPDTILAVFEA
ncbi:MAG: glycerophosphodiester phosphodiesterase family protein [Chloroflexota bacterium]